MNHVSVPRPTQTQASTPLRKQPLPLPPRPVSKIPLPPPAPRRPSAKPAKAAPPPLPETVLLTDADLVDEDVGQSVRASQPTSVDVELDCFSRTEPPPESRPQRKRALLALVSGLVFVAASGLFFLGRPVALQALRVLDADHGGAAQAPAMLTATALSTPVSRSAMQTDSASASSAGPRPKLSLHAERGKHGEQGKHGQRGEREKTARVSGKKPAKPLRAQSMPHHAT